MTGPAALVWFKRDLRLRDHAPLAEAMQFESALGLVVIEPAWLASPECDARHVGFYLDCVAQLQRDLAARGLPLLVRNGPLPQVLQTLRREFPFTHLFSHEETGPGWSYQRDLAVADWCRARLAAVKLPRYIVFVDALPQTPTQRVAKHLLRQDTTLLPRARDMA